MLHIETLGSRLDHQFARAEPLKFLHGLKALTSLTALLGRQLSLCGFLLQPLEQALLPAFERLGDRVVQERAGACLTSKLGDTAAHRASANNPYDTCGTPIQSLKIRRLRAQRNPLQQARSVVVRSSDIKAQEGTSALMPVIARPMISFWIWDVPSYRVVTRTSRK